MPYYHICPDCGAYLDPGERCDCQNKKEAAPVLQHQNGKVDLDFTRQRSTSIISNQTEESNHELQKKDDFDRI